jgi:crossover junction endodeoxyribonuclease RusA
MEIIEHIIDIPMEPVACPRPRVSKFGAYYPKKYKDFQKQTKAYLKTLDESYFQAASKPVHIVYTFIFARPKYMTAKKYPSGRILHNKRPDLDNLVKAINDAIQSAGIIDDDSQIYSFGAHKYYAAKDEQSSIMLTIQKG